MKPVTLVVVDEPADFRAVRFKKEDWEKARKLGGFDTVYSNAREVIKNSAGMYRIKPTEGIKQVEIKGVKDPDEMTSAELVAEMTSHGKPPRKKMDRKVAVEFVRKLREEAAAMIVDEETEDEE